jgi:hypothetical protein
MLKLILGTLSFSVIVFFASLSFASANTDADWAIHYDVYQPSISVDGLAPGYQINYWAGECVLRLGTMFTHSIDTLTVRVANAVPVYVDTVLVYCETRD